jgi:hypothetical protein
MFRQLISIGILYFFLSCSGENSGDVSKSKLIGTWLTVPDPDQDDQGLKEQTTFYEGDSMATRFYLNGVLQKTIHLTYSVDPKEKTLVVNRDGHLLTAKVLELSESTLRFQFVDRNSVKRTMKRIED